MKRLMTVAAVGTGLCLGIPANASAHGYDWNRGDEAGVGAGWFDVQFFVFYNEH